MALAVPIFSEGFEFFLLFGERKKMSGENMTIEIFPTQTAMINYYFLFIAQMIIFLFDSIKKLYIAIHFSKEPKSIRLNSKLS